MPNVDPLKPEISFDDFAKADLRVGTVISAERIPKTDKLIKMEVDFGIEKRIIAAGVATSFDASNLVGRQLLFVINIPPRNMPGKVVSHGMLLAAERTDGVLALTQFTGQVPNGATAG